MSQDPYMPPSGYPPGYSPPGYPYYGAGAGNPARGPARRASNLMIIVGIIGILFGVLFAMGSQINPDQLPPGPQRDQFVQNKQELERRLHTTWEHLTAMMALWSGIPGVVLLVLGVLVRRGDRTWLGAGLVVTGALLALLCAGIVRDLVGSVRAQAASGFACFYVGAFVVFALQISWLFQAYRASGAAVSTMAADQQAQYWQYIQQQQQMYSQWYGQGQAPPPPPGQGPVAGSGAGPPLPPPPIPPAPPPDQWPRPPENPDRPG